MTTIVFPGQGSQFLGMGNHLYDEFKEFIDISDSILGYSIKDLCLNGPESLLNDTAYTQPALFVINALSYLKHLNETQLKPNFVIGHSLGEYNALFAAEVFDFVTGLKLTQKRGELMSQMSGGGMAAVIGLKSDEIQKIISDNADAGLSIANYNSATQTVITGSQHAIMSIEHAFTQAGASLYLPLKVSGAFHSPFMNSAKQSFNEYLKNFTFNTPSIPVIANLTAAPYPNNMIDQYLGEQMTNPVLFRQSIQYLLNQGETEFLEMGPGKVLTNLINRILKGL